jgi:hypothetical protein
MQKLYAQAANYPLPPPPPPTPGSPAQLPRVDPCNISSGVQQL